MKIQLHIIASDAQSNILITLQHTGVHYPTRTVMFEREIEIPDLPEGFDIASVTIKHGEGT